MSVRVYVSVDLPKPLTIASLLGGIACIVGVLSVRKLLASRSAPLKKGAAGT